MLNRREFVYSAIASGIALPQLRAGESFLNLATQLVTPFPLADVRITAGPFREAQEADRRWLHQLSADRLLHNFRVNAGLSSPAQPLGGWEAPDCELRGHFTGHFLSAISMMSASTGDTVLRDKANAMVAELAKCQNALGGGYLSAFPLEYWDRLKARQKVWAPFYTLHKIMAGLLDVNQFCGNQQALDVLEGMAGWVDRWSKPISHGQMQDILNTENGGMNEVLYNLAALVVNKDYAIVAHRFDHEKFFDPLALRRDELTGLHANTNVPKVIGAARRYELTQEARYREIAEFFWQDVTDARTYCTGGTSNDEHWLTEPYQLSAELEKSEDTNECCVAYNMLKLTRHLYQWTASAKYFDYYERTLYNHRLGTIEPTTGGMMYFLPLRPGGWKIFNSEYDSFWCCTGTGVEEYSKLGQNIYFHDDRSVFVNLFIPSRLEWKERGVQIEQQTRFPEESTISFIIHSPKAARFTMQVRIPAWAAASGSAKLNGRAMDAFASSGSYLAVDRTWNDRDRLELDLAMSLWSMPLPDDPTMEAVFYGPILLGAELGGENLARYQKDQPLKQPLLPTPVVSGKPGQPNSWIEPVPGSRLRFRTKGQAQATKLAPLYTIFDQRYALYWRVSEQL